MNDNKNIDNPKCDDRPAIGGYAPGGYYVKCRRCEDYFVGDKRSWNCADCAYELHHKYESEEKIIVYKFTINDISFYDRFYENIKSEIDAFIENYEIGDSFTLTIEEMYLIDYKNLPEFDGF